MHKNDNTNNGMLTRKNMDKLMALGKELGLPEEDILHAYNVSQFNAKMSGEPMDFDSLYENTKSGLAFHFEVMTVANEISVEFDMDTKEAYLMIIKSMMSGDAMAKLIDSNETINDITITKAAGDIIRSWLKLNMQF